MQKTLQIGICVTILFCNAFSLYANSSQNNLISKIYHSKKLDDDQKRDSISKTFFRKTSPNNQLQYADELIKIANINNDFRWLYRAYYYKANAYIFIADLDEAYNCYLKSLDALKRGDITEGIGDIYLGIGNSFSIGDSPKKAIFYYKKALKEYASNSDTIYISFSLLSIVNEFHNLNILDSINHYISLASSILDKKSDSNTQAYLAGYKAMLYAKTNKIDSSLNQFAIAEKIFSERGRIFDIITFQTELTKILLYKNDYDLALKFAQDCYNEANKANLKQQICDAAHLLSDIYKQLGNYKEAFYYQSDYINYKDSVNNEETIRKMADLRAEYEISQKQVEIDYLEKRRLINKIALITAIAILLILFVLTYLLFLNNRTITRQASELQDLNETKNKMFSIISHDLRSPISSITGYFSYMKELALNNNTEELVKLSDGITKSLQNISSLLDNLLHWASNQQGQIPYNPEVLDIHEICAPLLEVFENSAKAKGISLHLDIDKSIQLFADKNTFETIFRNLIGNAIKFTNSGDSVTIGCKQLENKIQISVSDTGIGISKEKIPNLFDVNKNNSTWGTANEKGVGLGLRLAHEFTELNKGKIYVESEEGVGTTFFVEFPK